MRKIRRKKGKCFFCENKVVPDFTDSVNLTKFISERGKILSSLRTSTCTKHQRQLTKAIKRARFLSLIPFTARI